MKTQNIIYRRFWQLGMLLRYKWQAKSPHGIHSPFVFDFITLLLRNKHQYYVWSPIEALRTRLLKDRSRIQVRDLGAKQSEALKSNSIKNIAKRCAIPKKYGQMLFQCAILNKSKVILEIGTSLGLGTAYLATADTTAKVITIEGCAKLEERAKTNFKILGLNNIKTVNGNFDDVLPNVLASLKQIDMVYLDGNHTYEATLRYMQMVLPNLATNAIVVVDDIYWSTDMYKAWLKIKQIPQATVSIDLYRMGLLFFNPGAVKQDFKLRY